MEQGDSKRHRRKQASAKQGDKLQEQIDELKQQIEGLKTDLQRERADFTNFRRRSEIDQTQILASAKTQIIQQILPIFDDLDRALAHTPEKLADDNWVKGIVQVRKEIGRKLNNLGVEKVATTGHKFDPQHHEAVGFEDGDGEEEVVTEELRPGYTINGEVMRPAMVKVGKQDNKKYEERSKEYEEQEESDNQEEEE